MTDVAITLVLIVAASRANGAAPASSAEETAVASSSASGAEAEPGAGGKAAFVTRMVRGRVVWMADALARRHGVTTVPEAAERVLALETPQGELYPIVEDLRGRAFRRDKRLRNIDIELLVRQYHGSSMLQVIQVYEIKKEGKYEIDYWCEICSIAMFELKPCDCCQGLIDLRRRRVEAGD